MTEVPSPIRDARHVPPARSGSYPVRGGNAVRPSVVAAGHAADDGPRDHDLYVEVRGPAATDVHHNFVQRWNEASVLEQHPSAIAASRG